MKKEFTTEARRHGERSRTDEIVGIQNRFASALNSSNALLGWRRAGVGHYDLGFVGPGSLAPHGGDTEE